MKLNLQPINFASRAKNTLSERLKKPQQGWKSWFLQKLSKPGVYSVLIIVGFLLLARALGFVRNIFIYQKFDKEFSDLFIEATKIPELITSILILGTVVSALLPVASRIKAKQGKDEMVKFINLFHTSLLSLVLIISLVIFFFLDKILAITVAESSLDFYNQNGYYSDFLLVNKILLLGPIIFASQNLLAVFLNIEKRFLAFSLSALIYNIGPVLVLIFSSRNDYIALSSSMILAGAVGVLFYYLVSLKNGYFSSGLIQLIQTFRTYKKDFYLTWMAFLPRLFLLNGMVVANQLINKVQDTTGQVTAFDIGISIQGIFLVLIMSIGTVLFPDMASLWNKTDGKRQFFENLFKYNKYLIFFGLVGFLGTFVMAPVVLWFFELFGKGQNNAEYITLIVRFLAIALVFQSVTDILTKYFYIRERIWQPVFVYSLAGFFQIGLTFYLAEKMDAGIAASIGLIANVFLVYVLAMLLITRDYKIYQKTVAL